jgi:uncharacterized membrane protein
MWVGRVGEGATGVTERQTALFIRGPTNGETMSEGGTATADERADEGETDDGYNGVLGTYPYAFRQTDSRLMRSYVAIGGLVTALVVVGFTFALVQVVARTVGTVGGTFSFVRTFFVFVGMVVVIPLMAPVLLVARRHRRSSSTLRYDRALAGSGFLFIFSLYVALIIAAPPELRETPSGALAPVVEALYGLPAVAAAVPPLVVVAVGYALHRRLR